MENTSLLFGLAAVPVIVALVQVAKNFVEDARYWPLIAIAVGVLWNVAVASITNQPLALAGLTGVVVGLAAAGLYDIRKTIAP